jgi:hypothetical protein
MRPKPDSSHFDAQIVNDFAEVDGWNVVIGTGEACSSES